MDKISMDNYDIIATKEDVIVVGKEELNKNRYGEVNAKELYDWAKKNKDLKVISEPSPIQHIVLHDIKIKLKHKEDRLFLSGDIPNKLRRGNCIIEDKSSKEFFFGRKGLVKFYDYKPQFSQKSQDKQIAQIEKKIMPRIKGALNKSK